MEQPEAISQEIFQFLSEYMYIFFNKTFDQNKNFVETFLQLMQEKKYRILTFDKTWDKLLGAQELANAGFIQVLSDNVECVFCRLVIEDFCSEHDPHSLYPYHFPKCPYIIEVSGEDETHEN